jgi:hypothetical protein
VPHLSNHCKILNCSESLSNPWHEDFICLIQTLCAQIAPRTNSLDFFIVGRFMAACALDQVNNAAQALKISVELVH